MDLYTLPADVFAIRLGIVFNTFWSTTLAPKYLTGDLPSDPSALPLYNSSDPNYFTSWEWINAPDKSFVARESAADVTVFQKRYVCSKLWLSILIIATAILIIGGLISVYLQYTCLGPEVLGFVSALTMNNPYIHQPQGGCTLHGSERTRLMANMKVGIVDVAGDKDIGHIAFSSMTGPHPVRLLEKKRVYSGPQSRLSTLTV